MSCPLGLRQTLTVTHMSPCLRFHYNPNPCLKTPPSTLFFGVMNVAHACTEQNIRGSSMSSLTARRRTCGFSTALSTSPTSICNCLWTRHRGQRSCRAGNDMWRSIHAEVCLQLKQIHKVHPTCMMISVDPCEVRKLLWMYIMWLRTLEIDPVSVLVL